jgi:hypothetical protein
VSDERNDQQPTADSSAPPTAQSTGPGFDDALVRAVAERVHNAVYAEMRRKGVFDRPAQKAPPTAGADEMREQLAAIQLENARLRAYDRACMAIGLDDEQAAMLEPMYRSANVGPEQTREWIATTATRLKIGARPPTTTQPTTTPPASPSRSISDAGAPVAPSGVTEDTPLLRMSPADRLAWADRNGGEAFIRKLRAEMKRATVKI